MQRLIRKYLLLTLTIFVILPSQAEYKKIDPTLDDRDPNSLVFNILVQDNCSLCRTILDDFNRRGINQSYNFNYHGEIIAVAVNIFYKEKLNQKELFKIQAPQDDKAYIFITDGDTGKFNFKNIYIRDYAENSYTQMPRNLSEMQNQSILYPIQAESIKDYKNRFDNIFSQFNIQKINLDYFLYHALNEFPVYSVDEKVVSKKFENKNFKSTNVLLIGSAYSPHDNPLFNSMVIGKIKDDLKNYLQYDMVKNGLIFYGAGDRIERDTLGFTNNKQDMVFEFMPRDGSFTRENLDSFFNYSTQLQAKKNLLVLVGHGVEEGASPWLEQRKIAPTEIKQYHDNSHATNIMVSGICYGGQFASSVSCGFFSAGPKSTSSGCWGTPQEMRYMKDYSKEFFNSLNPANKKVADIDGNGDISFIEAHWFSALNIDRLNHTYTSVDALADSYIEKHAIEIPREFQLSQLDKLLPYADRAERYIINKITPTLNKKDIIYFTDKTYTTKLLMSKTTFTFEQSFYPLNKQSATHTRVSKEDAASVIKYLAGPPDKDWRFEIISVDMETGEIILDVYKNNNRIAHQYRYNYESASSNGIVMITPNQLINTKLGKIRINSDKTYTLIAPNHAVLQNLKEQYYEMVINATFEKFTVNFKQELIMAHFITQDNKSRSLPYMSFKKVNFIKRATYPKVLLKLIKRLIYKQTLYQKNEINEFAKLEEINSCERQSIKTFIQD